MALNQSKDVEFRIYDGDTPPNYIIGRFIQDGSTIGGMGPGPMSSSSSTAALPTSICRGSVKMITPFTKAFPGRSTFSSTKSSTT